jgi:hypothetical protein
MAAGLTTRLHSKPQRMRGWRSALAALISLALVLSVFHGLCADDDVSTLTLSATQVSCDVPGKSAPDSAAPHGDHCLAHVTTVAPQDNAVAITYVTRIVRLTALLVPETADLASPFKPPRA